MKTDDKFEFRKGIWLLKEKLRILLCILYYLPHRTGMQLYVQRISEELVRRGHAVTILSAKHQTDLPTEETINGVRIVRAWAPPIPISRGMVMPSYPAILVRLLREHDVVSLHTPMLETALIAMMARLMGKSIVATHHGDLHLPSGFSNRVIEGIMFILYWIMGILSEEIVLYSEDYARHSYYAKPFMHKVKPIYPPITMPLPQPEEVQKLRQQWSNNGAPVIGYAGRFVQEKRPDLLIQSLDTIHAQYPGARVVFAGQYNIAYENTWELYQPIVQQYQDHLIFLGMITDMQMMANFFAACDVLALTSDSECFALVQVEAMLCGTPVMMTNIPGGRVPVNVTGMGKLANAGDAHSMGQAILDLLNHPEHHRKERHEIESIFSFEQTVNQYEALFQRHA